MVIVNENQCAVGEVARTRATNTALAPTFMVAGEPYQPAGDAALVLLEHGDVTPSGAYGRLRRGARAGLIRTVRVNGRHAWYHTEDVRALADELRST